jgi:hypothetical protein
MQKYLSQYKSDFPKVAPRVYDCMNREYSKFHVHDHSKVLTVRTKAILGQLSTIPSRVKMSPDRMSRELSHVSIPEFTNKEIDLLLEQRQLYHEWNGTSKLTSITNQVHTRQFGIANNISVARLFPNMKTPHIHLKRVRELKQQCCEIGKKTASNVNWNLTC